jgi:hypothetical protein
VALTHAQPARVVPRFLFAHACNRAAALRALPTPPPPPHPLYTLRTCRYHWRLASKVTYRAFVCGYVYNGHQLRVLIVFEGAQCGGCECVRVACGAVAGDAHQWQRAPQRSHLLHTIFGRDEFMFTRILSLLSFP